MRIVFFTGAGVSQASGIPTFRDRMALWDTNDPERLASIVAWRDRNNRAEMLRFHNVFRTLIEDNAPNEAHQYISDLQNDHDVIVVTQNVDNFHERAGSNNVIHLHGNLFEARSSFNPNFVYTRHEDISLGDRCERGSQLRPNVVWFGEELNQTDVRNAEEHIQACEIFVIIGTSLNVDPAAGMVNLVEDNCRVIAVDPNPPNLNRNMVIIQNTAIGGLEELRMSIESFQ